MDILQEARRLYLLIRLMCHVQLCNHFYFKVVSVPEAANPQKWQKQRSE